MKKNTELEKKLKVRFKNKELLQQALTHRSYLNENPEHPLPHNERLEFLGDAVLELIVTEHLFSEYPKNPEGEMTAWRAALVNTHMLGFVGKELEFGTYLLLSKGEAKEEGKGREYILANTVEAFIGALYLDQGLKVCDKFISSHIMSKLPKVIEKKLYLDAKSLFQEHAQAQRNITPTYQVVREWGPDHAKEFLVGVYLGDEKIAEGHGLSKQEAEDAAARAALELNGWKA